jgi:hypothetical protein
MSWVEAVVALGLPVWLVVEAVLCRFRPSPENERARSSSWSERAERVVPRLAEAAGLRPSPRG